MNTHAFVDAIKTVVCRGAAKGTLDMLQQPSGRRPDPELLRLSQWFQGLSLADRQTVAAVVELAATQTTYNFLLVFDGLLAVEPPGKKGKIELFYRDGKTQTPLNDESIDTLSALFKERA